MVDKTDNTMVKRIKGGEGGDKQWWTRQTTQWSSQDNKTTQWEGRGGGGDKQWWTRQTTQWSRE